MRGKAWLIAQSERRSLTGSTGATRCELFSISVSMAVLPMESVLDRAYEILIAQAVLAMDSLLRSTPATIDSQSSLPKNRSCYFGPEPRSYTDILP